MAFLLHQTSNEIKVLSESTSSGQKMYLEGIFAQAEVKNGNGRIYPKAVLEKGVTRYINEYIKNGRSLGEINHPDRVYADPANASIIIESLTWQGNNVIGKALILDTDKGRNLKALIEGGFKVGVSTRGLGSVTESSGTKFVNDDFVMTAIDAVDNPSGPDCFPNAIMESKWALNESGVWVKDKEELVESDREEYENLFLSHLKDIFKS